MLLAEEYDGKEAPVPGMKWLTVCPDCNGRGTKTYEDEAGTKYERLCDTCGGTGSIEEVKEKKTKRRPRHVRY